MEYFNSKLCPAFRNCSLKYAVTDRMPTGICQVQEHCSTSKKRINSNEFSDEKTHEFTPNLSISREPKCFRFDHSKALSDYCITMQILLFRRNRIEKLSISE